MFFGREVDLKLYKLAAYEAGVHCSGHMDSTHSDKHHATHVALLTSSEDTSVQRHRNTRGSATYKLFFRLQAVVFFTDTEHRIEPVKFGIRIVLHYDSEPKRNRRVKTEIETKRGSRGI